MRSFSPCSLRKAALVFATATVCLVSGCTVGPNFHPPAVPAGASYGNQAKGAPNAPAVKYGDPIANDWYHLLGSSQLNALVHAALQNNPDLQAAQARISQARAQLRAIDGGSLPQLKGRALTNRAHFNSGALMPGSRGGGASNSNLFAGLLQLSYNIDVFGKQRRQLEAGRAAVEYQRDQALNTYIGLVNQVVTTALDMAAAQSMLDATQSLVTAQQKQLKLIRLQERVGTVARAQALTAQAKLEGTQAKLPALQQRRAAAVAALAALVGKTPGQFKPPRLSLADFNMPGSLPVSVPSQLIRQRPDILAAQQMLHQASARIGVAVAARLPSFSLSANYGSLSSRGVDFFNASNALWSLGSNITAPLFDGGTLKAKEDKAKAAYLEADAQYRSTVLKAFAQVATALRALDSDAAVLNARERALGTARQALKLSALQLSSGAADELQLLSAQQEYRRELLSRVKAKAQGFTDIATLMHALGGGWWNAPRDPLAAATQKHSANIATPVASSPGEHHG